MQWFVKKCGDSVCFLSLHFDLAKHLLLLTDIPRYFPFLQVVNFAQGMSMGPALYLWTHRLTNTDVFSVVTTTLPCLSTSTTTTTTITAGGGMQVASVARRDSGSRHRGPPFEGSIGRLEGKNTPTMAVATWFSRRSTSTKLGNLVCSSNKLELDDCVSLFFYMFFSVQRAFTTTGADPRSDRKASESIDIHQQFNVT